MRTTTMIMTVFALTACADPGGGPDDESPAEDRQVYPSTTLDTDPSIVSAPEHFVAALVSEVTALEGVEEDQVTVVRAQQVMWSDASLGCPGGGVSYIQVLTPGYWVVLEAEGNEYDFRSADDGEFRRCDGGVPPHDVIVDR
ncbi:MAG TPA: hypothetical protein VMM81_00500 [Acidimicrobiia bacterium]|nr:hypothetical protein [Acidimicrobiia bacterium]